MADTSDNDYFGFRNDNPEFIAKIAKKYGLSTEGILPITHVTDKIQLEKRFESRLRTVYPGSSVMWNSTAKSKVFNAYTNDNLDIFGFAKVVMPKNEGEESGQVVMVPFHMKDPLARVQELF